MTDVYLVIEVGYEGIDRILRAYPTPEDAVRFYNEEKQRIIDGKEENPIGGDYDDADYRKERAERLCIQKVSDKKEAECVCIKVGLPPKDKMRLY